MTSVTTVGLRAEYGRAVVGVASPRLSWRAETDVDGWRQAAYEVEVDGGATGWIADDDSVFRPWPAVPLRSRDVVSVRVRVRGDDGAESPWSDALAVEAGLLDPADWVASWITPTAAPTPGASPAHHLRRELELAAPRGAEIVRARLHVTSAGVHTVEINGVAVGDHVLAPGWSAYASRLRYDTHDVTALVQSGANVVGAVVADGWYRGKLGFDGRRAIYGDRLGLLAQLEVTWSDGSVLVVATDDHWRTSTGPVLAADLYDGETFDARLAVPGWSAPGFDASGWGPVERFDPGMGHLVVPLSPPVRRIEELPVVDVLRSPSGATILDLGQNLVGWVRFTVDGPAGTEVVLRHVEVLEHGELATAPLRGAAATDRYVLAGGGPETWEPSFTFHGFRYVEVTGWPGEVDPAAFTAVVVHTDMERTGTFECSCLLYTSPSPRD